MMRGVFYEKHKKGARVRIAEIDAKMRVLDVDKAFEYVSSHLRDVTEQTRPIVEVDALPRFRRNSSRMKGLLVSRTLVDNDFHALIRTPENLAFAAAVVAEVENNL